MDNREQEDFLMELITGEVRRAAESDPDFAPADAQRRYGEVIIREMPSDLAASVLRRGEPDESSSLTEHKRLQHRLLNRWRFKCAQGVKGGPSRGM